MRSNWDLIALPMNVTPIRHTRHYSHFWEKKQRSSSFVEFLNCNTRITSSNCHSKSRSDPGSFEVGSKSIDIAKLRLELISRQIDCGKNYRRAGEVTNTFGKMSGVGYADRSCRCREKRAALNTLLQRYLVQLLCIREGRHAFTFSPGRVVCLRALNAGNRILYGDCRCSQEH